MTVRGTMVAPKCVTPGVCAWSHRSSISISIKIRNVQQYILAYWHRLHHHGHYHHLHLHHVSRITYHSSRVICHVSLSCIMYHVYSVMLVVEKTPPIFVCENGFQGGVSFLPLNLDVLKSCLFWHVLKRD